MNNDEKINILMVDDQPQKLMSYEVILLELGQNLIKATSGKEALEHLLKKEIGVVLMDVSMPDIGGFELADMIRQHPRFRKTAIIFISGIHLSDGDRMKGYQSGAVDYISVPVIPELLRAKVSVFAELHRKTRQLELLNQQLEERVAERSQALKKLNLELKERFTELHTIMQVLPVGVAIAHDPECQTITGNTALSGMLGLDPGENLAISPGKNNRPSYEVYERGNLLATEQLPLQKAAASGEPTGSRELEIRHPNGTTSNLLASANPLFDDAGQVRGAVAAFFDATQRVKTEEALRKTEKLAAMGRVAGIVAHEINNPLEAITNCFYLLRDHPSLNDDARALARLGEEELERVCHITRQTLSFYRESQRPIPVCIADVLDDVLELQARPLQLNGITLEKQYRSRALVQGFPVELKQVFLNLISNAIQAMPSGGRLRVRVYDSLTPSGTYVSIIDNGIGFSSEQGKRLFEPFFTTKSTKGTGLGLWISRGIVQKYEGSLRCRSMSLAGSKATCFTVFIPGPLSGRQSLSIHGYVGFGPGRS